MSDPFNNNSRGIKKSNFIKKTAVDAGSFSDFFKPGSNYQISYENLVAGLGVTGSIVSDGAVSGTPVLDTQGTVNNIRAIEAGSGLQSSVSPENGVSLAHDFLFNTGGVTLCDLPSAAQPIFSSLVAGSGINISTSSNQIQIAAGTPLSTKTVTVGQLSNLPTPEAGVITLASGTVYQFIDDVSLGTNRLVMEDNSVITGSGSAAIDLTYTGVGVMITATDASARIDSIKLTCATGTLLDITDTVGSCVFQMIDMTVAGCATIGTIDGVLAVQFNNVALLGITTDGLTLANTIGVVFILGVLGGIAAGTLIDLGTASIASITISTSFITVEAPATFLSGLAASGNISDFATVINNRITGAGTALNNISQTDDLWQFFANDSIADSRVDVLLSMQGNATNTAIADPGAAVLVAGTWVVELESKMTGTTGGRGTYTGQKNERMPLTMSASVKPVAGGTVQMSTYVAVNGAIVANSRRSSSASSGDPTSITATWQHDFAPNDYVEMFIANDDTTVDLLVSSAILRIN